MTRITKSMVDGFTRENAKVHLDWFDHGSDNELYRMDSDVLFYFTEKLEELFPEYFSALYASETVEGEFVV